MGGWCGCVPEPLKDIDSKPHTHAHTQARQREQSQKEDIFAQMDPFKTQLGNERRADLSWYVWVCAYLCIHVCVYVCV